MDALEPRPYSSREFIFEMGKWLANGGAKKPGSLIQTAYEHGVPIFCPAFTDSSAGFGLVKHQVERIKAGQPYVTIDAVADFRELTEVKMAAGTTGLFMVGGGVPKNFAQDTVVCAEILGQEAEMHKYAVQITVADVRDGACSSSTLKEACSWGKVDVTHEQMVFARGHYGCAADRLGRLPPRRLARPPGAPLGGPVHQGLSLSSLSLVAAAAFAAPTIASASAAVASVAAATVPVVARGHALLLLGPVGRAVAGLEHRARRTLRGEHGEQVGLGIVEQPVAIGPRKLLGARRRMIAEAVAPWSGSRPSVLDPRSAPGPLEMIFRVLLGRMAAVLAPHRARRGTSERGHGPCSP